MTSEQRECTMRIDPDAVSARPCRSDFVTTLRQLQSLITENDALQAQLADARAEREKAERQLADLRCAVNAYRGGIMALNPALSAALCAHLPEPQGGDSEF